VTHMPEPRKRKRWRHATLKRAPSSSGGVFVLPRNYSSVISLDLLANTVLSFTQSGEGSGAS
jgi:hypothetical protein